MNDTRRPARDRRRGKYAAALFIVIAMIVIILDIAFILIPDKDSSEVENRMLQTLPRLTLSRLISGDFEEDFESYTEDQFPLRTTWIQVKSAVEIAFGKRENNGIFLGKDGYLIQNFEEPNEADYEELVEALNGFSEAHPNINQYMLIAPTALTILSDKLPSGAVTGNEDGYLDRLFADVGGASKVADSEDTLSDGAASAGIIVADVRDALKEAAEETQIYYRTDHHWTTDGAYEAYKVFSEIVAETEKSRSQDVNDNVAETVEGSEDAGDQAGADSIDAEDDEMSGAQENSEIGEEKPAMVGADIKYNRLLISDSFSGTLSASSGFRMSETDEIYVYLPAGDSDDSGDSGNNLTGEESGDAKDYAGSGNTENSESDAIGEESENAEVGDTASGSEDIAGDGNAESSEEDLTAAADYDTDAFTGANTVYTVTYPDEGVTSASFYVTENLEKRNQYTVFFNENHPEVDILTSADTGRVLLILKDSYANCFVPFLAPDYDKIIMIDPRYYTGAVEDIVNLEGITDVLYLYSADNLAGDRYLAEALR